MGKLVVLSLLIPLLLFPAGHSSSAAPVSPGAPAAAASDWGPFRLVSADEQGVTVEYAAPAPTFRDVPTPFGTFQSIEMAGHGVMLKLGWPALPQAGVGLAVPEEADARLSYTILESRDYPGVRPVPVFDGPTKDPGALTRQDRAVIDQEFYSHGGPYPEAAISYNDAGHLRHHRVGQISISPAQFIPGRNMLTLITRARIRVDFRPGQSTTPRGAAPPEAIEYVPQGVEPAWENTYRDALINYDSARAFRVRPLPRIDTSALDARAFGAAAVAAVNPEFRIAVGLTGMYYVSFADLAARGWPDTIRVDQIRLYEKSYRAAGPATPNLREIPIQVVDASGTPGRFDADDYFYFYGLNYQDRFQEGYATSRFTYMHNYWLSWRPEGGARMTVDPGWFDAASFVTPTDYVHHAHFEQNMNYIYINPVTGGYGGEFPVKDQVYWLGPASYQDSLEYSVPGRVATKKFRIQAEWQGVFSGMHYVSMWLTRTCTAGTDDTLLFFKEPFSADNKFTYDSGFTLNGARLSAGGCNRLKLQGNGFAPGDPNSEGSGSYFNWFDVDYPRSYAAYNGFLRFTSGTAQGNVEFAVRGLTQNAALIFDVTDSLAPRSVDLTNASFVQISGPPRREYELHFRAGVGSRQRTYVLYTPDVLPPIGQAVAGGHMPPDLGGGPNLSLDQADEVTRDTGADVIVIAHPSLEPALAPWVALRQSQGHTVRVVTPQDIWDEFSGGDKSVPAIRTWLQWIYRHWARTPDYLLLFGDASEDYRKDTPTSNPDWVPTMMKFGPVPGADNRLELIGSDNYYVGALGPHDPDFDVFPDMYVGRLSVGGPDAASALTQAQGVISKLVAYDSYSPADDWRNRGLLVSDDEYSTPITEIGGYCFQGYQERDFVEGADSLCAAYAHEGCYTGFQCEQFRLADIMNQGAAELGRTNQPGNCPDMAKNIDYAKRYASPAWVAAASRGHLFQIFSGHGNRFVMTTERFVEFNGDFTGSDTRTPDLLTNYGKPFIYVGVACHLNEFEHFQERSSKASVAEEMVLLPNRGAIASIASSGFEWLYLNKDVEIYLGRGLFLEHFLDPVTQRPRRILGEGFSGSMVKMALEKGGGPEANTPYRDTLKSYCLLGDPTMRYDMAPPALAVTVGGEAVEPGAALRAPSGQTTVALSARVADDVDYRTDGFSITEGDSTVPSSVYTSTPYEGNGEGACRGVQIGYTPTLRPATYAITLHATDWLGRSMDFPLNVRTDIRFALDGTQIHDGELVPFDAPVRVTIESPVTLPPSRVDIRVNGVGGGFTLAPSAEDDRVLTGQIANPMPGGEVRLETRVDGHPIGELTLQSQRGFAFNDAYFYPSPWEGHGDGSFTFQLSYLSSETRIPSKARVTVYSISGRKVADLEGSVRTGRNALVWNMRDNAGDGLANGVYLYKLIIESADGTNMASLVDRLVIHR